MDIISGIVVATSVFLFTTVLVVLFTRVSFGEGHRVSVGEARSLTQRSMAVSMVVYFVAVINLLLIAQQVSLALGTFVVALVLLVVYYLEPAVRSRGGEAIEESESWER